MEQKKEKDKWGPHNAIRELLTVKLNTEHEFYGDFDTPLEMLMEIADDIHSGVNVNAVDTHRFMHDCRDLYHLFRTFKKEAYRLIFDCIGLMQDMGEEDLIGNELDRFANGGPTTPQWVRDTAREIVSEIENELP